MEFVTIEEARAQIRIDTAVDDQWLNLWIPAVEGAVRSWLKDEWRLYVSSGVEDSNGDPIPEEDSNGPVVQPMVKAAVLVELAQQYRFRDGGGDGDMAQGGRSIDGRGHGYILGRGATALLVALRKSTVQ